MSKIIIGIVTHEEVINNKTYHCINKNNLNHLKDVSTLLIIPKDNKNIDKNILDLCDGIIIPGGTDIYDYHFKIVEYCIKNNKPLLGICMGCQVIGLYSNKNNKLIKINNHYNLDELHHINIEKNSFLSTLFNNHYYVNSRHIFTINNVTKPFKVTAYSDDNIIEAIELVDKKKFILGVQWHPEDMKDMNLLYTSFVKEIEKRTK